MKLLFTPALAATLLALATQALRATPLDDCVAELKHAVEKEATMRLNGNGGGPQNGFVNPGMNPAFIDAQIDQIVSQMQNPAYGNTEGQLAQITSIYTSTEVQEATTNLLNEIKKERKEKTDAEIAEMKALMTKAGKVVEEAKKPEDLDDLIAEMGKHANNPYGGNPALQGDPELSRQLSSAFEFVKQYQNYLSHMATGQTDAARNDLQMLSNNNGGDGLMPRSKVLELENPARLLAPSGTPAPAQMTPAQNAQGIADDIKTLADIKPGLAKLQALRASGTPDLDGACQELSQMDRDYESTLAGLPADDVMHAYPPSSITLPPELRTQLQVLVLQSHFESFKGPAPAPDEKPADFIQRVIADAIARQDWELLREAVVTRNMQAQRGGMAFRPIATTGGIESIIVAEHQEEAGQFALAVQSYETALKSDDPAIPAKLIGDKLAALERDHPKEYGDGMQLTVSPPSPRFYLAAPLPASLQGSPTNGMMPAPPAP